MVEINLNLVKAITNVIDVCAKRGAFEGSELEVVGQVRRELLTAAQPALEEEAKAKEAADGAPLDNKVM
jgi:hypothetical protein